MLAEPGSRSRVRCSVCVKACGICGSDRHFAKHGADVLELNNQIDGFGGSGGMHIDLNRDVFMGHAFSAEVLEAGPDNRKPSHLARSSRRCRCFCRRQGFETDCVLQPDSRRLLGNGCCCRRRS